MTPTSETLGRMRRSRSIDRGTLAALALCRFKRPLASGPPGLCIRRCLGHGGRGGQRPSFSSGNPDHTTTP